MKTLSKKLLTLLLACVMLVSVVPFQAMAADVNVRVRFVKDTDGVSLGKWEDMMAGYESTDPEDETVKGYLMDAELAAEYLGKSSVSEEDKAAWEIDTSKCPVEPEFNGNGVWVYNIPMKAVAPKHEHKASGKTDFDKDNHWDVCECGEKLNVKAHTYNADGKCECGAEKPACEHKNTKMTNVGNKHVIECVDCEKVLKEEKHSYNDKGECTVCGAEKPVVEEGTKITFIDTKNDVTYDRYFKDGKLNKAAPSPLFEGYEFKGWFTGKNGTGNELDDELKATNGPATTFYSHWAKGDEDGVSRLTVYAKLYAGGKLKKTVELLSTTLTDNSNAFKWLSNNESTIADKIDSNANIPSNYVWGDHYYYDYEGKELLTQQDLEMKGNKSVVVKLYSKDEATVLVYVHRKTSSAAERILELNGFVKGDVVDRDDVLAAVKKHYTGSNMKLQGLYTTSAWNQLKNGEKPTAANGITVEDNGTLKIHVLLTNATTNKGEADPSNPKTGDSIFMAVTVMAVSASALAVAYIFNKKRMVK